MLVFEHDGPLSVVFIFLQNFVLNTNGKREITNDKTCLVYHKKWKTDCGI